MSVLNQLPPLRDVISDWHERGEFYFYKRFLDEMRTSIVKSPLDQAAINPRTSYLSIWLEKFNVFMQLGLLLIRCVLAPKGKTLVFNHSARQRRTGDSAPRSLYLSKVFDYKHLIVFEDSNVKIEYPQPAMRMNSMCVNRCAEICAAIYVRLYKWKYSTSDRDIVNFYSKKLFWEFVFKILKPNAIRLFVWYGKEAVISAAKSLGIETADVQHGIIYPSHPLYNLIPSVKVDRSHTLLPAKCLVYGEYWKKLLLKAGWEDQRVDILGYFLDINSYQKIKDQRPYILYTSQPHTNVVIIKHIQSILPEIKKRKMRVVIALHPSENNKGYSTITSKWIEIATIDTYDLIQNCAAHISISSTLLWEAMIFAKSSYVLEAGKDAKELLTDLISFGFGRKINEKEFPEPFILPKNPSIHYFFQLQNINRHLLVTIRD